MLIGVLVLARLVSIVVILQSGQEEEFSILGGDARRYAVIVGEEGTPYRDYDVEYPPLALGLMHAIERPTSLGTLTALSFSQLALELATAAVLAWAWSRRAAITYLVLGSPMLLYPFPYLRIDLLSVFLAVLGLGLLRRGRERTGGAALALSVFANNPRAIRCYQKAGFVHEGCLRQALYRNGQFHDEYRFSILRDEWSGTDPDRCE